MRFSWDPAENRKNIAKQFIALADAARIFDGPTVEQADDRFDYGEDRVYAIGLVDGIEITVIYADPDAEERRIIAAWRATPRERQVFWQALGG